MVRDAFEAAFESWGMPGQRWSRYSPRRWRRATWKPDAVVMGYRLGVEHGDEAICACANIGMRPTFLPSFLLAIPTSEVAARAEKSAHDC